MADTDTGPRNITTDHETIREWVEARDGQPAHITGRVDDDATSLYIVQEDEEMAELDPLSWDEFFETFEAEGLAFVYQDQNVGETDEWLYDIVDREEIVERAALERGEIEAALLEGEVVESEITETKVIETTVVETDRIESEVVDSEIIETIPVDRETLAREIVAGEFVEASEGVAVGLREASDAEPLEGRMEATERTDQEIDTEGHLDADTEATDDETAESRTPTESGSTESGTAESEMPTESGMAESEMPTESGMAESEMPTESGMAESETTAGGETPTESDIDAETVTTDGLELGDGVILDVRDTVLTTTEVFDRKTVESRVVEREVAEDEVVATDEIDLAGVEETILESEIVEGEIVGTEADTTQEEAVPGGAITSEQTDDDVVESQFVERRMVETESTEHRRLGCEITDHKLVDVVEGPTTIVERAIVDREAGEEVMLREPEEGIRTTDEQLTAAETSATTEADAELATEPGGEAGEPGATEEPTTTGETETTERMDTDEEMDTTEGTEMTGEEMAEGAVTISDDDIGKQVVSGDDEIGMVSDADEDEQLLYVDPNPSLGDRIKAALDWGETGEDTYSVGPERIVSITDNEVRLDESM